MNICKKACSILIAASFIGTAAGQAPTSDQERSLGDIARELRNKQQAERSAPSGKSLVTSYQEAAQVADEQERSLSTRNYFSTILLPYFGQKYASVFKGCFDTVPNPDSGRFSFVVAIGTDGRMMRLYNSGETNIFRCMRVMLEKDVFPPPPVSPYYLHIDMSFTDVQPAAAFTEGDKASPLILEPGRYSYTFAVPQGWAYNFEQAQAYGARLVFFPKGGSFDDSNSIVYVTELCQANCKGIAPDAIERTIEEAKQDSPNLKVVPGGPLTMADGGTVPVRILTGARDTRQAKEALAFIEHNEAIILVVLTTKNTATWPQDYAMLQQIVSGHKFFTCDSPKLEVPCQKSLSSAGGSR